MGPCLEVLMLIQNRYGSPKVVAERCFIGYPLGAPIHRSTRVPAHRKLTPEPSRGTIPSKVVDFSAVSYHADENADPKLMAASQSKSRAWGLRERTLGIFCVLLIAFCATVQVVHAHPAGTPHSDCALCVVAHSGVAPSAPIILPVVQVHAVEVEPLRTESPRESFVFSFYSRPPPAESASL
jgi:hypothetical protein